MKFFRKFSLLFVVLALLVVPAIAQDSMSDDELLTIADIVVASATAEEGAEFTTLLAAVQAADEAVLEALSDPEAELTVFAPTDEAFAALIEALGEEAFNDILADTETLTNILLYHVVPGVVMAEDVVGLEDGTMVDTLLDDNFITVTFDDDGNVFINDAQVIVTDIEAANGVIHVIDAVLVPSEDTAYPTIADIVVTSATAEEGAEFTTLLAAVQAADEAVLEALSDPDAELTVFAPTDEAFAALIDALGEEAFNDILADSETLTNILLYHVVPGVVMAEDVVMLENETAVDTLLEGDPIIVTFDDDGNVFVDGAQVIVTDIKAANGVIHVIDAVIVPDGE
ncbi:MAG: fasciclin domain-containing protein [Chloroflexi bacterium]|nr:MAG: fasciclin domain-containing protein [Chloroflexota bacterium]